MTDKQILESLRKIQIYCAKHKFCEDCKFQLLDGGVCQIQLVLTTLDHTVPLLWELNKTKAVLEK